MEDPIERIAVLRCSDRGLGDLCEPAGRRVRWKNGGPSHLLRTGGMVQPGKVDRADRTGNVRRSSFAGVRKGGSDPGVFLSLSFNGL